MNAMITLQLLACIDVSLVKQDEQDPAFDSGAPVTVDTADTDTTTTVETGDSVTVVDTGDTGDTGTTETAVDTVDTAPVETADTAPDEPTPIDVAGVCTGGYPYTSWYDTAAAEPELHLVGVYESQLGTGGAVDVKVTRTAEGVLVLTSYSAVDWQIELDAAHDITEILISSYDPATYTFTGAGSAPVVDVGWIGACAYEIPDTDPYSGCETPDRGGGGSAPTIPWPWVPGSPIVTWPDIPDFSYLADIEISTSYTIPSSSSEDATVYPSVGGYFDVHAHSFCSTESDWATAEVSYDCLPTNTVDRIDWLYDALTAEGIGMAAISGQADPSAGSDFIADTATVNEVTLFAYQRYPDFFAPFIQIFPEDLTDSTFGASSYVDALLAAGEFKGVGELFIHGHGTNINENGYLYGICLAAARYGAPVQMHYEIGFVDDESVRTSEDNYDQLVALLDMFINVPIASHTYHVDTEPMPLKVILCHCGGAPRPGNYAAWDSTDEDLYVAYIARMEALLARYPNVFFDLAGMQVGGNQQLFPGSSYGGTETRFGSDLLTLIAAYPSRFLFGTDTENRYDVDTYAYSYTAVSPGWAWYNGVDHWQDSVQGYVDFLGTLGATIQAQVMGANTVFAIYTKARRI